LTAVLSKKKRLYTKTQRNATQRNVSFLLI
jgi:hypothetical protein